jgi:hypothetical protein
MVSTIIPLLPPEGRQGSNIVIKYRYGANNPLPEAFPKRRVPVLIYKIKSHLKTKIK